jgi:transcriptional regulator with XRE-family HTH domain
MGYEPTMATEPPNPEELRITLRRMREDAHLSQNGLAKKIGVTSGAISRIESGERDPSMDMVRKWADACGRAARITFVMPGQEEAPQAPASPPLNDPPLVREFARALPHLSQLQLLAIRQTVWSANYSATLRNDRDEHERLQADLRSSELDLRVAGQRARSLDVALDSIYSFQESARREGDGAAYDRYLAAWLELSEMRQEQVDRAQRATRVIEELRASLEK